MSQELKLEDVDVDGAIRETAAETIDALDGDTRSQFLRRAGLAGGALVGGGAILGALAPSALAFSNGDRPPAKLFGTGDFAILRFALVLEYLESSFYNEATRNQRHHPFLHNSEERTFLRTVTNDENQHVKTLKSVLGSHAIREPKFNFRGDTKNHYRFLKSSFTFENEGVHAYSGQAFNFSNPAYLAAALSIVTVEARHAAVIGLIRNHSEFGIAPSGAFDKPLGATQVLKDVTGLKYITKLYPA